MHPSWKPPGLFGFWVPGSTICGCFCFVSQSPGSGQFGNYKVERDRHRERPWLDWSLRAGEWGHGQATQHGSAAPQSRWPHVGGLLVSLLYGSWEGNTVQGRLNLAVQGADERGGQMASKLICIHCILAAEERDEARCLDVSHPGHLAAPCLLFLWYQ